MFSVVLSPVAETSIILKTKNQYIKDVTLNKSIDVFERQVPSCFYCFRISVTKLSPTQNASAAEWFQVEWFPEWFPEINTPLLAFGSAGVATLLAGKIRNFTHIAYITKLSR